MYHHLYMDNVGIHLSRPRSPYRPRVKWSHQGHRRSGCSGSLLNTLVSYTSISCTQSEGLGHLRESQKTWKMKFTVITLPGGDAGLLGFPSRFPPRCNRSGMAVYVMYLLSGETSSPDSPECQNDISVYLRLFHHPHLSSDLLLLCPRALEDTELSGTRLPSFRHLSFCHKKILLNYRTLPKKYFLSSMSLIRNNPQVW